jgi:GT2 family glycosyltransferase
VVEPTASVDVVIITWNDGELVHDAIASLDRLRTPHELIVVDNGSEPAVSLRRKGRLLRNDANRGVAPARNQGARAGSAPYVLLLDSDAQLLDGCVEALLEVMEDPSVGAAVPVFEGQPPAASAGRAPGFLRKVARGLNLTAEYRSMQTDHDHWDVDFGIGACQLIRRKAFETVGGLDDSIFYGPEDVDFCLRLRDEGWRIVQVAGAICRHPPRRRFKSPLSRSGARHAVQVARHLARRARHRRQHRRLPQH